MRSYYEHLEALFPTKKTVPPKPIYRSSAIFPVFHNESMSSRILFLGYWLLKRNINQISCVITLRSQKGDVLDRKSVSIEHVHTHNLELKNYLSEADISLDTPFVGSLEVEFFSTVHLVFAFPAVVINYYGPDFTSVVHTAQRVYNDYEDMKKNSQTFVPESGFNIYADDDHEPFIGMINGVEKTDNGLVKFQFFNSVGEELVKEVDLGPMSPYETRIIYPAQLFDLKSFLKGKAGAAKVIFHLNWIFPRLTVGNIQHSNQSMTLTHTYYDCSHATQDSDYWREAEKEWYPASLATPICFNRSEFTNIYFYPIYSPAIFWIDIEIYNKQGQLVGKKNNALKIESGTPLNKIELNKVCEELGIKEEGDLASRIIARPEVGHRLPARIKLGVDIGKQGSLMPCNICTNLAPFNPQMETKPISFRWSPVLADYINSELWIFNSNPMVNYSRTAELNITFYHEQDNESLSREMTIPPNGFIVIRPDQDPELKEFFGGKVGWFTAITNNPYTSTYYFAKPEGSVVGGDHGF